MSSKFIPLMGLQLTDQPLPGGSRRDINDAMKRNRGIQKAYDNAMTLGGPETSDPGRSPEGPAVADIGRTPQEPQGPGM